jgi:hypothetical protein
MPFDALEYIVRPYQTPDALGRIIIPSAPRGSPERATITWGGPADMPQRTEVSDGVNFEVVCCQEDLTESSRESNDVQIPIQEDANYVTVSRPTSLKLKKKELNKCGDNWDQISGVAQEVNAALEEFSDAIHSGTVSKSSKNCSVGWKFKN